MEKLLMIYMIHGIKMVKSIKNVIILMVKYGLCESWHVNGQINGKHNYIDGKMDG